MTSFEDEILNFLKRNNLLANAEDKLLELMGKNFSDYSTHTSEVINQLIIVTDHNPQLVIDVTKRFLTNKEPLTKLWALGNNKVLKNALPGELIPAKAKAIASLYELAPVFSLAVHLLTKRKVLLKPGSEATQILKHLQVLGLTSQDREDIRLIRNADSHLSSFVKDAIIFEGKKVPISRIDELYYKLNKMMEWNINFILFSLFYVPKFGILVTLEIYLHVDKFNLEWQDYFEGVKLFYKTEIEERANAKAQKKSTKEIKVKSSKEENLKLDNNVKLFILRNIDLIADCWHNQVVTISGMLSEIENKILSSEEKELFEKAASWINSHGNLFLDIREKYRANPKKYNLIFFGTEELNDTIP